MINLCKRYVKISPEQQPSISDPMPWNCFCCWLCLCCPRVELEKNASVCRVISLIQACFCQVDTTQLHYKVIHAPPYRKLKGPWKIQKKKKEFPVISRYHWLRSLSSWAGEIKDEGAGILSASSQLLWSLGAHLTSVLLFDPLSLSLFRPLYFRSTL